MSAAYTEKTTFVTLGKIIRCGGCGIVYAFDERVHAQRRRDGKTFYCPNGCRRAYLETEADRLRRELDEVRQATEARVTMARREAARAREQRDHQERRAIAFKGHLTRTKKRVGNGVCPCCNRSFKNLRRHMQAQHPSYTDTDKET